MNCCSATSGVVVLKRASYASEIALPAGSVT